MILINFEEPQTEEWKIWRQRCKEEQVEHNAKIQGGLSSKVKAQLYKGQKRQVYIHIQGPFSGKCAYCEQKITRGQPGDIEHFRPKNEVRDANGILVRVNLNGQDMNHPGYYWLAYHWKNLLPSCSDCNRVRKINNSTIGKGTRFPVNGAHAIFPGEEDSEDPLLLHPVIDNPDEHLEVDASGALFHKSEQGDKSIEILGLNIREQLVIDRKNTYDSVKREIGILCSDYLRTQLGVDAKKIIQKIVGILKGHEEFSLAGRKAINDARSEINIFHLLLSDHQELIKVLQH